MKRARIGRPPGQVSKYRLLADELLKRLESGEWQPGSPIPSCRQLSMLYGVGVKTAWLAQKRLKQLGRAHGHPRRVSTANRSVPINQVMARTVVIVSKMAAADFYSSALGKALVRRISEARVNLLHLTDIRWWRNEAPGGLIDFPISGLVIYGPFAPDLLRRYETLPCPVVLLDQPGEQYNLSSVAVDNFPAAFDATSRLIAVGHRRISFVRVVVRGLKNVDPDGLEREAGFSAACRKAKLREENVKVVTVFYDPDSPALSKIVTGPERCTAVVCADLHHAELLLEHARKAGLSVPRDLSIVCFHGADRNPKKISGPAVDFGSIGNAAFDLIQRQAKRQHVKVEARWEDGSTVGRVRKWALLDSNQ